jgi:hypothetical protein
MNSSRKDVSGIDFAMLAMTCSPAGATDHGGHPEQLLAHGGTNSKGQEGEDEPWPTLAAAQTDPLRVGVYPNLHFQRRRDCIGNQCWGW